MVQRLPPALWQRKEKMSERSRARRRSGTRSGRRTLSTRKWKEARRTRRAAGTNILARLRMAVWSLPKIRILRSSAVDLPLLYLENLSFAPSLVPIGVVFHAIVPGREVSCPQKIYRSCPVIPKESKDASLDPPHLDREPLVLCEHALAHVERMQLHDQYLLYVGPDAYTLIGQSDRPETLTLTRASSHVSIKRALPPRAR